MRIALLLLAAASVSACSGTGACAPTATCVALHSTAKAATGSWMETQAWRNVQMQVSLSAFDTRLFGSANYWGTGLGAGTAKVTGYVFWQDAGNVPSGRVMPAHPVVVLDFAFDDGTSAHFDQGTLSPQGTLSGVLTFSDDASTSYGTIFIRPGVMQEVPSAKPGTP